METEDLDKILGKSYSELNPAERETIQEICGSEEEFLQLQQFFASVEDYAHETKDRAHIAPEKKESLDKIFHQTYQKKGILWYNAAWTILYPAEKRFDQRPLVRVAAILILLISIVPFVNKSKVEADKTVLAKNETAPKEGSVKKEDEKIAFKSKQAEVSGENQSSETLLSQIPLAAISEHPMSPKSTKTGAVTGLDFESTPTPSTTGTLSEDMARTFNWSHSDGIYMDTFKYDSDAFILKENLAVLDLLTPTF